MSRTRVLCLAALAVATGCGGYHWVRESTGLGGVHRVAVQAIANHSYEPGIEMMVTDALRREFQRHPGTTLVEDPARADLVLSGAVTDLFTAPRSFSSVAFGLEYQVELRLALVARRPDGSTVPLDLATQRDWELYLTSADVEAQRKNRDEALRRLTTQLAARVHDALEVQLTQ